MIPLHQGLFQRPGRFSSAWPSCLLLFAANCHSPAGSRDAARPDVRVAAFSADVTPPLGHPLCGGWILPLAAVDDPLLAKGIVLADGSPAVRALRRGLVPPADRRARS